MLLRLLIFTLFSSVINIFSQTPTIEPGVSQTLAKWRAANYSDVRYKLNITLEKGAPLVKGDIEIRVNLTETGAKNDLVLDWRATQFENDKDKPFANVVSVNTTTLGAATASGTFDYQTLKEHLLVSQKFLKAGENVIKVQFVSPIKTSGAAVTRYIDKEDGAEYVYSLFVPSDASTAFPMFDQPDLKARFKLAVNIGGGRKHPGWTVVSNTEPEMAYSSTWNILYSFKETKPISTYVFAFAAGDFTVFNEHPLDTFAKDISHPTEQEYLNWKSNKGTSIYVRKSQAEKFKQHAAEVFRLNREAVKYLESYFDYKFPFPKYDLVLIPEFPFGGMEHAGATFLREDRVIFPTEPTKNDYITRANVIFHEAAHQWFGDTVTMRWFDDLWLKEGFAEFMAYKTLEKVMPEYNAWKIFYERNKQAAYLTDATRGTTPIYQEIPNLSAAKSAYGNIVYRKAPSFLRQAEFYLGADKFQIAVRAFLKKHEFANAEWTDLVKEFESASGKEELGSWWATPWVKGRGMPLFNLQLVFQSPDRKFLTRITQRNSLKENLAWSEQTRTLIIHDDGKRTVENSGLSPANFDFLNEVSAYVGYTEREPRLVFPNYQDYGYGIFLLDERSRAYVLENIQTEKDDFLRAMMWGSLWDSVRETELAPKDYVELVIKNINVETDESTIQTLLGRVSTAMNYYLSDKQRKEFAPQLEAILIDKMQSALTLGQRITFNRAFLNVASSERARTLLKDILKGKPQIKDLKLKTKDRFDIVTKLLILGDKDAPMLLVELEKTETSDEAKRYAYAAKAGIATAENKAKFWNDFINNKNVSESWIEAAFTPFNSVKHSEVTLPYLEKALAELPNLKRNRKIFFVNGWLGAFIGGQKSAQSLQIVNKFLADNPNLDKDLRLKVLENVDGLERAVKIRTKYGS